MPSEPNPSFPSADLSGAVGRTERATALIAPEKALALAATLDLDMVPGGGEALPPGWHWMFFNPFVRRCELGEDGHPRRGGFLPDVGLPRRMWAGGRMTYHDPLPIGCEATRDSEIIEVSEKSGRAGRLVFVTVRHVISSGGGICLEEEQDIVYREAPAPGASAPPPAPVPEGPEWSMMIAPDPVMLFRYSALTANSHRIHYDTPYAREVEGYPDLVVHGPLIATLLQNLAAHCMPGRRMSRFDFRAVAPLFVNRNFHIEARRTSAAGELSLWSRGPDGGLSMRASAAYEDREER